MGGSVLYLETKRGPRTTSLGNTAIQHLLIGFYNPEGECLLLGAIQNNIK